MTEPTLRERIAEAIHAVASGCFVCEGDGEPGTCVGVNRVADAVMALLPVDPPDAVIINRERWERVRVAAQLANCYHCFEPGDLEPSPIRHIAATSDTSET
jgi:hypothetical protein